MDENGKGQRCIMPHNYNQLEWCVLNLNICLELNRAVFFCELCLSSSCLFEIKKKKNDLILAGTS